jgi:hypothetical protein
MSTTLKRFRSVVITIIVIASTNYAISLTTLNRSGVTATPDVPKPRSGVTATPDVPKPKSGVTATPDVPKPKSGVTATPDVPKP